MTAIDETHDPTRRSFVKSANGHSDFPIQNLPLGIFSPPAGERRGGVAIGDQILDLGAALASGLFTGEAARAAEAASGPTLNAFLALGGAARHALRARLSQLLMLGSGEQPTIEPLLHAAETCMMDMPMRVGDYTDFYVGIHHATNVGKQFRPDNPLLPNYKHVPIGYHGRASSVCPSGAAVRRPNGQRKAAEAEAPSFGPSRRLDYELELGVWIGAGNKLGEPIPITEAAEHVGG
jgi:fumarylacetoacetase